MLISKRSGNWRIQIVAVSAVLLCVFAGSASAGAGYADSQISAVRVDKSGKGYVVLVQAPTGTVAECRDSTYSKHLAFDTGTPGGRAVLALVLTAHAQGASIAAYGTGTCTFYPTEPHRIEDWSYGFIK